MRCARPACRNCRCPAPPFASRAPFAGSRAGERSAGQGAARFDRREPASAAARKRDFARGRHRRPRAAFATGSSDRSAAGPGSGSPRRSRPISRAPRRSTPARCRFPTRTSVEVVKSAYRDRARGLRPALWRRRRRRLAQHALRRDPERRRLHRHAAVPRHRSPDRESRPTPRPISAASRNIPRSSTASSGGCARRARKGLVPPDFLIDKALNQLGIALKDAREGGGHRRIRSSAGPAKRTFPATGTPAPARSSTSEVAPALQRQIAELTGRARRRNRRSPACGRGRTATNIIAGRSRPRRRPT